MQRSRVCRTVFYYNFRLNVYFRDVVVLERKQYPRTGLADLFSNIGGLLGLWAGLSLMTLVEIVFFICNFVFSCFLKATNAK